MCIGAYIPYFKINAPIFCCFIFFEECLNSQVRIYKMVKNLLLITTLVLQNLFQGYTLLYFYWHLRGLSLQNISWIFSQTCISRPGKYIWVKKLDLFTHGPKHNSPPIFYHHHSRQKEITHFPQRKCFEKEREDYRTENMTKIKLARVLVISFDKFHHLQPLHFWFLFSCTII